MKPCSNQRKQIALLTVNALNAAQERDLRTHLENCAGCSSYLAEMLSVSAKLNAANTIPEIETPEAFHRKLVRRIEAEERNPIVHALAHFRTLLFRPGVAATAVFAVLLAGAFILMRNFNKPTPAPYVVQLSPSKPEPAPTLSNYQIAANHSLDKLDELLTRQANRNVTPLPAYKAAILSVREEQE